MRNLQLALRIASEDIVGRLYRESEVAATGIGEVSLTLAPPKTWYERWIDTKSA